MPKTTLALKTLKAKPKRKAVVGGNEDVDGQHLMAHFGAFLHHTATHPITDSSKNRYLQVKDVIPRGRAVTVVTVSGVYGEAGSTFNVETHEKTYDKTEVEAPTTESRLTVWAPPGATHLAVAIEYKPGGVHGGALLSAFRSEMLDRHEDFWFPYETVLEKTAWAESGQLAEVSVIQHTQPLDYSTDVDTERQNEVVRGSVVHTAIPPKGVRYWPQAVWDRLRNHQIEAATFIGLRRADDDAESPDEDVYVTVVRDGRQKRFALGTDGVPSVRVVLSEDGEPPLDLDEYHQEVDSNVRGFYEDLSLGWNTSFIRSDAAEAWIDYRWKD